MTLLETDRILACPFCRVRLMIQSDQPLSYSLPLPEGGMNGDDLVFAPYWRFKGAVYALNEDEVTHRIVDMTTRAAPVDALPYTLGMRPQTLKLRLSLTRLGSRSFTMSMDRPQFLKQVRNDGKGQDRGLADRSSLRAAVGEVVNLLYAPYLLREGVLHDPYTGRALSNGVSPESGLRVVEMQAPNGVRFEATLCPDCGWDMEGSADSHVLFCRSCQSSWEAVGRGFHRLEPQCIPSVDPVDVWVPFWRIDLTTTGFDLATYEDFVRLTNVPKVINPSMGSHPFSFWVPAFKIQPKLFLRLSGAFTLAQPSIEAMPLPDISSLYPCTLPAVAGFQSVPVVLGAIAPAKRDLLPKIKRGRFAFRGKQLVWVPFQNRGVECIQSRMEFSIPRDSLRWGRAL
ncbi:MAG: hypothetical protein AB9873_11755 [Syntrophobacteraceae bacterium]